MMNSVLKNMENFAKDVLKLPTEAQNELFKTLEETLTPDEVKGLKELVGLYRLHTDSNYYKVVEKTLAEQLYKEFNKGE
jgi:hypothetical protein